MAVLQKTLEKPFEEIPKYKDFRLEVEKRRKEGSIRYVVLKGGRGSAKTRHAVEMLTRFLFGWRDRIYVLRKNEAQNRESIYSEIKAHLKVPRADGVKISSKFYKVGKSPKSVITTNRTGRKGEIVFGGLRFSQRIKGSFNPDITLMEEADEFTYEDFTTYEQTVRHQGAIIILLFNPPHEGEDSWLYKHFFSENSSQEIKDMTMIMETNYLDNPYLDPKAVMAYEALKKTNPYEFERSILGLWTKNLEALVFPNFEIVKGFEVPKNKITRQGLDFGFTNPMAFLRVHLFVKDGQDCIYVEQEKYKNGLTINDLIPFLEEWNFSKGFLTFADSEDPSKIEDLKRAGFMVRKVSKPAGSILKGISYIKSRRLIVNENCSSLIKELKNYSWKKNRDGSFAYGSLSDNQADHAIDALRYTILDFALKDYSKSYLSDFA